MEAKASKTFKERVAQTKPTRWVRFAIVSVIFFAWVIWLGNWWVALAWLLLFDIYITGYIPFTWWKRSKSAAVRTVMGWVDAIVYALILVYFVFAFVGQNYQIPSSSLEKTLLVGDYLWVNKMAYGPRVPMTPVHFPLVHNTLPIINTKSYLDSPSLDYHRLKGFGSVERGDIVVFNFPAGDTVCTRVNNPDYYTLVKLYGRERVNADKATFGDVIYRPVDRRENYVKRCVGLPGDRFSIVDGVIHINGEPVDQPVNAQFNYYIQTSRPLSDSDFERVGIAVDDRHQLELSEADLPGLEAYGFAVDSTTAVGNLWVYASPLTAAMVRTLETTPGVTKVLKIRPDTTDFLFPEQASRNWTRADYGEVWIPKKGETVPLNAETWDFYGRAIKNYEHNDDAELRGDTVYIGGKPAETYTFKMDYYFMMGDNRDNSLDSRYWGFVPEDHIVGRPYRVLVSFDKDKGWLDGKIRWNRVFKDANSHE